MQRIQYHRYSGPEEMLWPRAIGTDFSGVLESIGSTEGRVHPHGAYVLAQGNIALDHQRFVEASGGGQGELTI